MRIVFMSQIIVVSCIATIITMNNECLLSVTLVGDEKKNRGGVYTVHARVHTRTHIHAHAGGHRVHRVNRLIEIFSLDRFSSEERSSKARRRVRGF